MELEIFKSKLAEPVPVVVLLYAEWCGPCSRLRPIIEVLAKKFSERAVFRFLNIEQNLEVAESYRIYAVPTLLVFKDGLLKHRHTGYVDGDDLEAWLNMVL